MAVPVWQPACFYFYTTDMNIARIGDDFFKFAEVVTADRSRVVKMFGMKRQTIIDDFGVGFLKTVPKFQAFINVPDNYGEFEVPPDMYNLYHKLDHQPKRGQWKWTEILLRHIFGDQYELGLDYIQLIYDQPLQLLPVLSLVSKENQTGKTTFLNWLNLLFKDNMIIIGNQELTSQFNFIYGSKLIIAIEESRIERSSAQEKLKALATQKKISLNDKFQRSHTVDFFGKLILASNHEDNFISANKYDIRYWVRKIPVIPDANLNYDFETDLKNEVDAFVYFLRGRELSTKKESRAWFSTDLIQTEALEMVREQSHTPLYFDLVEALTDYFSTSKQSQLKATAKQLLERLLPKNNQYNSKYLGKVLKDEFLLQYQHGRYDEIHFTSLNAVGRYYTFKAADYVGDKDEFGMEIPDDDQPF
jgi:hypothetical protein